MFLLENQSWKSLRLPTNQMSDWTRVLIIKLASSVLFVSKVCSVLDYQICKLEDYVVYLFHIRRLYKFLFWKAVW